MTRVAILPIATEQGGVAYRAVAGARQSEGKTAGAALDGLAAQLSDAEASTLVIVQSGRPDAFFDAAAQQRLAQLMAHWRGARDQGSALPADEQAELTALVDAEVRAAAARAAALADDLGQ